MVKTQKLKRGGKAKARHNLGSIGGHRSPGRADRAPRQSGGASGAAGLPAPRVQAVDMPLRGSGKFLVQHARPSTNIIDRRRGPMMQSGGGADYTRDFDLEHPMAHAPGPQPSGWKPGPAPDMRALSALSHPEAAAPSGGGGADADDADVGGPE